MPDLPFQGALKLRGINTPILNTDTITEVTGPPIGENDKFPSELISFITFNKKPVFSKRT